MRLPILNLVDVAQHRWFTASLRGSNIGDSQLVLFQNTLCFRNLFRVQVDHVLVPHVAQFDPLHTEFARHDVACTVEILCYFVTNDRNSEG